MENKNRYTVIKYSLIALMSVFLFNINVLAFKEKKNDSIPDKIKEGVIADYRVRQGNIATLKKEISSSEGSLNKKISGVISYQDDDKDHRVSISDRYNKKDNPLILLNGKRISPKKLAKLSPVTIENFSIFKGEKAIEQYGEKAEKGVIVVTTKSK